MLTLFIFITLPDEAGYPCVLLRDAGDIEQPLTTLAPNAIIALQAQADSTVIVLSSNHFTLFSVALPLLPEKKARLALTYALEEHIAQNMTELHLAFDRRHYRQGHYDVIAGDKHSLDTLIQALTQQGIAFDTITIDWCALAEKQALTLPDYTLIRSSTFQGALSPDLAAAGNHLNTEVEQVHLPEAITAQTWIAQRLVNTSPLNLCQGQFQLGHSKSDPLRWYYAAAGALLLWFVSMLGFNTWQLYANHKTLNVLDKETAIIYRQFFPGAKLVVSPRFRISKLLQTAQKAPNDTFWVVLAAVTEAAIKYNVLVEQIRFQNTALLLSLSTTDFNTLESFEAALRKTPLTVKQTQAATRDKRIYSTLELTL